MIGNVEIAGNTLIVDRYFSLYQMLLFVCAWYRVIAGVC